MDNAIISQDFELKQGLLFVSFMVKGNISNINKASICLHRASDHDHYLPYMHHMYKMTEVWFKFVKPEQVIYERCHIKRKKKKSTSDLSALHSRNMALV